VWIDRFASCSELVVKTFPAPPRLSGRCLGEGGISRQLGKLCKWAAPGPDPGDGGKPGPSLGNRQSNQTEESFSYSAAALLLCIYVYIYKQINLLRMQENTVLLLYLHKYVYAK
jgi:hypothetical protein